MSLSSHFTAIGSATQPPSRDEAGQQIPYHLACAGRPQADILVDGSISYMFGPRASECYFGHLLKEGIRRPLLCWDVPGWPGACFTSQGVLDAAAAAEPESGTLAPAACLEYQHRRPGRLLDYDARGLEGTVVPQAMWRPQGQSAIKKYVVNATLQWPVFFVRDDNRTLGFPLQEGPPRVILGGQTYAPLGGQSSLHVRIKVWTSSWFLSPGPRATTLSTLGSNGAYLPSYFCSGLAMRHGNVNSKCATTRTGGIL